MSSTKQTNMAEAQYNYPLSTIFGSRLLRGICNSDYETMVKGLLVRSGLFDKKKKWNFEEALTVTYEYLRNHYRCEYVYKNEIANQLLLRYHDDNSATLLSEFNINHSIADIVIVNGATSVYEIKTELDNLGRLSSQVLDYTQVFDNVTIVTHAGAILQVKKIVPEHVGVALLQKNGKLIFNRRPSNSEDNFNAKAASRTLRQSELMSAYIEHEGPLPDVGTALVGSICRKWYCSLETPTARKIFKDILKSRKPSPTHFKLIKMSPHALKMTLLSREVSKKSCEDIGHKLNIIL